ncbi:TPA: tRNA lysidine(34) synthetase TilS, partial [Mannheimia haemolytica]|nr:tRNA lysidine(34) synthetase TilS [Mannheimia haemolytica]
KIWQNHGIPVWERNRTPLIFWQDELVGLLPIL